ncbi:YdcH family protein [Parasphingopyxis algicola]|uniref:YdcH family protein n=1 Tax=Parasphingopyxis algicola TaxID=2026624 RepID=UPI0015A25FA7|nr:YdcH family protein [Parasphingopyxis algicola]QLC24816.1 YdcH family protein [Parasphingopyxis algicola]
MSHVPHELAEEFPDHVDRLHDLKVGNAHFAKLADEYHTINREIHRIESGVEPGTDERTTVLRKQRLELKDEIAAMIFETAR